VARCLYRPGSRPGSHCAYVQDDLVWKLGQGRRRRAPAAGLASSVRYGSVWSTSVHPDGLATMTEC
jgi:hypothetical protein